MKALEQLKQEMLAELQVDRGNAHQRYTKGRHAVASLVLLRLEQLNLDSDAEIHRLAKENAELQSVAVAASSLLNVCRHEIGKTKGAVDRSAIFDSLHPLLLALYAARFVTKEPADET